MKTGITLSAFAHVAVLAGAMVSLAAPKPLSVPAVEALPIELVPIEELTKAVRGNREATVETPPAPKATTQPQTRPDAQNVGDAENDKAADAERKAPEPPVERTEAPAAAAPPPQPEEVPVPKDAPAPEPQKDIALLLKEAESDPVEPPAEPETVEEEPLKLPDRVAAPKPRPQRPSPEEIAAAEREKAQKAAEAAAKAERQKAAEAEAKRVAEAKKQADAKKKATVNKTEAAGGAKRSRAKEGLGTSKGNASKLAQSEIDALRGRLEGCWNVGALSGHPDADTMRAKVEFKLSRAGDIEGRVKVRVTGTDRETRATFAVNVRSAVIECAPYRLPPEKYETWSDVVVNFSLADML